MLLFLWCWISGNGPRKTEADELRNKKYSLLALVPCMCRTDATWTEFVIFVFLLCSCSCFTEGTCLVVVVICILQMDTATKIMVLCICLLLADLL